MIVEFRVVKSDGEEIWEREIQEDTTGRSSVPYHSEKDFIARVALDMREVTGFSESKICYNDQVLPCVYAKLEGEDNWTGNLLISYEDFKELFQKTHNTTVHRAESVLN